MSVMFVLFFTMNAIFHSINTGFKSSLLVLGLSEEILLGSSYSITC